MDQFYTQGCRYSLVRDNGCGKPCILATYPSGHSDIVAVMTDADHAYEHAQNLCNNANGEQTPDGQKKGGER